MLDLDSLAAMVAAHPDPGTPVAPFVVDGLPIDTSQRPALMGVVNLSRDSTYRTSVAPSTSAAVRRARIMRAEGADFIDLGAESSTASASRVDASQQIRQLVPVIEQLAQQAIPVSVEAYDVDVVRACLAAGARVLNLTGVSHDADLFALAAQYRASVIVCFSPGEHVRQIGDLPVGDSMSDALLEHFAPRVAAARSAGVASIAIDPGLGFYYANLTDPATRVAVQAQGLLSSYRLRALGAPVCQSLPNAFDIFQEHFRQAESYFAVLARLGKADILRTHEVGPVRATVAALNLPLPPQG